MWVQTSSIIGGGILCNLSLKGSSSETLISCFARSVQPNSQVPRKRCHGIQLVEHMWQLYSWWTIPPGQTSPAAGRALPFFAQLISLLSGSLASHWASLTFLVRPLLVWCGIHSYNLSDLDSYSNDDKSGSQILHHDCYSLATCSHLSIGIHDAQPVRQVGTIPLLQDLYHHVHVAAQEHGLNWACMIFEEKALISSFLVILTASIKSVRSMVQFVAVSLLMESSAWWQANKWNILNPFSEMASSSIYLSLITFMIWLIVSVPKMTSSQEPKLVRFGMTRVTWSLS